MSVDMDADMNPNGSLATSLHSGPESDNDGETYVDHESDDDDVDDNDDDNYNDDNDDDDDYNDFREAAMEGGQMPRLKRSKKEPKTLPKKLDRKSKPIPSSFDACDAADKMLIEERAKATPWKVIRQKWAELGGDLRAKSSLPNRYDRLNQMFCQMTKEQRIILLSSKVKFDREYAESKWDLIREQILKQSGSDFNVTALKREYKRMMIKEGVEPEAGIYDPDFAIEI